MPTSTEGYKDLILIQIEKYFNAILYPVGHI